MIFIYFQGKIKFWHCIWSIWLFLIFVYFYLVLPCYFVKWNLFFSWWTKICKILHIILESTSQFSFKFCTNLHWNQTSLLSTFLAQTLYTMVKSSPLKCKFSRFSSAQLKIYQITHVNFELTSQFLFKFCIILHSHDT